MNTLALSPRLDLPAAVPLAQALCAHAGADLRLDAGAVTHLGALGIQVLAAAAIGWRDSGHALCISPRSAAFDDALRVFGLVLADLQTEPTP